jgi:hypothetical protein
MCLVGFFDGFPHTLTPYGAVPIGARISVVLDNP